MNPREHPKLLPQSRVLSVTTALLGRARAARVAERPGWVAAADGWGRPWPRRALRHLLECPAKLAQVRAAIAGMTKCMQMGGCSVSAGRELPAIWKNCDARAREGRGCCRPSRTAGRRASAGSLRFSGRV